MVKNKSLGHSQVFPEHIYLGHAYCLKYVHECLVSQGCVGTFRSPYGISFLVFLLLFLKLFD